MAFIPERSMDSAGYVGYVSEGAASTAVLFMSLLEVSNEAQVFQVRLISSHSMQDTLLRYCSVSINFLDK